MPYERAGAFSVVTPNEIEFATFSVETRDDQFCLRFSEGCQPDFKVTAIIDEIISPKFYLPGVANIESVSQSRVLAIDNVVAVPFALRV
ncbi:MAG: hypothetical protein ABJN35_00005 [Erythrobacter sp.]